MNKTLRIRVLVLFTILFSLCAYEASAQSVNALIKHYKAMPEVTYMDLTDTIKTALDNGESVFQNSKEYMEEHEYHFANEAIIVGNDLVGEKYPDSDRKVAFEFSKTETKNTDN